MSVASEKPIRRKGDSGEGGDLRKNWIILGLIELAVSIGAIITVSLISLIVHLGFTGTFVIGWGVIFVVIGTVLTTYGFLGEDNPDANTNQQRHCPYCGRRVAPGAMICSRCGKA